MKDTIIENVISLNHEYSTNGKKYKIRVSNKCPICNVGTTMDESTLNGYYHTPMYIADANSEYDKKFSIIGIYRCASCKQAFIVRHLMKNNEVVLQEAKAHYEEAIKKIDVLSNDNSAMRAANNASLLILEQQKVSSELTIIDTEKLLEEADAEEVNQQVFPNRNCNTIEHPEIKNISPKFYDIYNQSIIAKNNGLNEIYGMGLRKALEQLITDYLINHCNHSREDVLYTTQKNGNKKPRDLHNIINLINDNDIKVPFRNCVPTE